jgi:hypothetical protein
MAFAALADQYQPLLPADAASPPDAVAEFQPVEYQVLRAQAGVSGQHLQAAYFAAARASDRTLAQELR